jgi:3-isopropylmalate dehydrogenase
LVGVLPGEGVGPDLVRIGLQVLSALEAVGTQRFCVRTFPGRAMSGGPGGGDLDPELVAFCQTIFAGGGAIFAGAMGGRFVYQLRRLFRLFCKVSPVRVCDEILAAGKMKAEAVRGVDLLLVRENVSGIYQGEWSESRTPGGHRVAEHRFRYAEPEVRAILEAAVSMARRRRGKLTVVAKEGGVPGITRLWYDCAQEIARRESLTLSFANVDLAAYSLLQHARELDVVVAPNLFGDMLADLAGVLLGSRALTYSGNFAADGAAVYQTNHGAASDLLGADQANPVGQIFSLAMLLRESFGLHREAELVEGAVRRVWREGWRTRDLDQPACRQLGTREMGERVSEAVRRMASESQSS